MRVADLDLGVASDFVPDPAREVGPYVPEGSAFTLLGCSVAYPGLAVLRPGPAGNGAGVCCSGGPGCGTVIGAGTQSPGSGRDCDAAGSTLSPVY